MRSPFRWRGPAVVAASLALAGCPGWRYQAGLANVPAANRPWTGEDFAHDVIANGDESCPASGRHEDDRLFRRWPACGGSIIPTSPPPRRRVRPPPEPGAPLAPLRDPDILLDSEP